MKRLFKAFLAVICILSLTLSAVACANKAPDNSEIPDNQENVADKNPLQIETLHAMLELAGCTETLAELEQTFSAAPEAKGNGNGNGNGNKVTVEDAYIDENGDFNVDLSNGNSVNAGELYDGYKEDNGNHYGQDKHNKETHIGHNGNWWVDGKDTGIPAKGHDGADGVGIEGIEKQSTEGLVDTYVIKLTNGKTFSFTVTNARSIEKTEIDSDGYLHIYYNDNTEEIVGKVVGEDGAQGTGIAEMHIDENGHLIVTLTDGTVVDCGAVYGDGGCNHTYGDWTVERAATCKDEGIVSRICSKCGDEEFNKVSITSVHVEIIDAAVAPTCTATGLTEGKHCAVCGNVLIAQSELAKIDHEYTDEYDANCNVCGFIREVACGHFSVTILPAKAVTCVENGFTEGKVCSSCEEILQPQEIIAALGHVEVIDAAVEPTCTLAGVTEGKHCSTCGEILVAQRNLAALGHTSGDWIVETEPTEISDGYKYKTCLTCGVKTDEDILEFIGSLGILYEVNADGTTCTVTGIGSFSGTELEIPGSIRGYKVTAIGDKAFENCTQLTKLTIPSSTKTIGNRAFYGCTGLTEFTVPASVRSIGTQIFYKASNLSTVYYNSTYGSSSNPILNTDSITKVVFGGTGVAPYILANCGNVNEVVVENSVKQIYEDAFSGCTNITSINIPDNVTVIYSCAFYGCTNLESVYIPDSVTSIGYNVFYGCTNLKNVYITDIDAWCDIYFGGSTANPMCYGATLYLDGQPVTSVVWPEDVDTIGSCAFYGCATLESVIIGDNVTSIGEQAFYKCSSLTSVEIPDSVITIGKQALCGCSSLTSVVIPDSVTSIGAYAFGDCSSLTTVVIPDSVTSIEKQTFQGCSSLTSVVMGDSVTSIGNLAFYACSKLKDVYYTGSEEEWANISIGNNNGLTNATIHYNYEG